MVKMEDFYISGNTLIKYKGSDAVVTIPESVKIIGRQAFCFNTMLTSVIIPEGVVTIGEQAFDNCQNLEKILIPSTVTLIEKSAFASCRSLDNVVIPEGVPFIATKTFAGCFSLKKIVIPDTVTAIAEFAFSKCYSLSEIVIGDNVTIVGENAFASCRSAKLLSVGRGLAKIEWNTFSYCESLEKIAFTEDIHEIVYAAFDGCNAIKDVYYSGSEAEWQLVSVARTKNQTLLDAKIHYNNTKSIIPQKAKQQKAKADDPVQLSFEIIAEAPVKPSVETVLNENVIKTEIVEEKIEVPASASVKEEKKPEPVIEDKKPEETKAAAPAPKKPIVKASLKNSASDVSEDVKNEFYARFVATIPENVATAQKARAEAMTDELFETLSEALFLVPADEAYEFGCMCLYMKRYNWAFRAFLSASGKGNLPAQYYVGCCFLWGIDTTKKIVDAARWLTKCKNDSVYGEDAKAALAYLDEEFEKPENAGLKVKRGNK